MSTTWAVFRRELKGYFNTPLAYIFIVIFLFLTGIFTFYLGSFFIRGQADLKPFFNFLPWLYLFSNPCLLSSPKVLRNTLAVIQVQVLLFGDYLW